MFKNLKTISVSHDYLSSVHTDVTSNSLNKTF